MAEARMAFPQLRHPFEQVAVDAGEGAIVICNERVISVAKVLDEPGLWVSPEDLTRINGFVLKPEGACLGELCIPIRSGSNLLKTVDDASWFNVAAFADLLEQSCVVDEPSRVWSFGEIPAAREAMLAHATDGGVVRAYRRTDWIVQRRMLAERWADHVTGGAGQLVKLAGAR